MILLAMHVTMNELENMDYEFLACQKDMVEAHKETWIEFV